MTAVNRRMLFEVKRINNKEEIIKNKKFVARGATDLYLFRKAKHQNYYLLFIIYYLLFNNLITCCGTLLSHAIRERISTLNGEEIKATLPAIGAKKRSK